MKTYFKIITLVSCIGAFFILFNNCSGPSSSYVEEEPNDAQDSSVVSKQCLSSPLEVCSLTNSCQNGTQQWTVSSDLPSCFQDGAAFNFRDASSELRYYCRYKPIVGGSKKPLIIWLHGGSGSAENLYKATQLRAKAERDQFHIVALQSRNLKLNIARLSDGHHFDTWQWDFAADTKNGDIQALDQLIDLLVQQGDVDTSRIYLMGWSEGGMLAQLYGLIRHHTASVYGHKVAAVVVYSGSSPFHRKYENNTECTPDLKFQSQLPISSYSRTCDVVTCNKQQETDLWSKGSFADVIDMQSWKDILKNGISNNNVVHTLLDKDGNVAGACAQTCSLTSATLNHLTWPLSFEEQMLTYLFNQ